VLALGSTVGAANDFNTSQAQGAFPYCDDSDTAPDLVATFELVQPGVLRFDVIPEAPTFNPAAYVRPNDCGTEWACIDFLYDGGRESISFDLPVGTYNIIVDGHDGTSGPFVFYATFDAPTCGDGIVSAGEECDTGGFADTGCTNCIFDPPTSGSDSCPGIPVALIASVTNVEGTTLGHTNAFRGSCADTTPSNPGGPDAVIAVTPSLSGILVGSVGLDEDGASVCTENRLLPSCWDRVLYARSNCQDGLSELDCSDLGAYETERVVFDVVGGQTYYLFVDGFDDLVDASGPFNLRLELH